jgi:hypothetical protein
MMTNQLRFCDFQTQLLYTIMPKEMPTVYVTIAISE